MKKTYKQKKTAASLEHILQQIMSIDMDQLEDLVQLAHESDTDQIDAPKEQFPFTRQALRMTWMFRRNLDAVNVWAEADK